MKIINENENKFSPGLLKKSCNSPVCSSQTGILITMCRVDGRMACAPQARGNCIKNKRLPDSGSLFNFIN